MEKWVRSRFQPGIGLGENGTRVTASKEHIALSKRAAKEGMVLLKNEQGVLPLERGTRVALFGKGTFDYVKGGGGSGDVTVSYVRNFYEGLSLQKDYVEIFDKTVEFYKKEVERQYAGGMEPGLTTEPDLSDELVAQAARFTDTAIISISRFSGESWDRKAYKGQHIDIQGEGEDMVQKSEKIFEDGDFYLTATEKAMVEKVKGAFLKIIVVMNVGGMVDTEWFHGDDRIQSVLMAWQGGIEGGLAAAELIVGKGSPSGKLSDTFAKELSDYPSTETFHESQDYVDYIEDIYVGYRYFETVPGKKERVNYPFGFGLSYTDFALSKPVVTMEAGYIKACTTVCNTGVREGREVVQVYYSAPQGRLGKPARVLAGYQKTRLLAPGESQSVFISFKVNDMASYDDLGKVAKSAWILEKGEYHFHVGTSVRDTVEADYVYSLDEDTVTEQLSSKMAPSSLKKRMLADGSFEELPLTRPNDPDESIFEKHKEGSATYIIPAEKAREPYFRREEDQKPQLSDVCEGKITLDAFVAALPDKELAELLGGQPNLGVANTFGFGNLGEYGVPNIMTADGPAGLRILAQCGVCTTAWPCATLLACTWDPKVTEQIGIAAGKEVKENNIAVWLAPAVNIHRSPLCGRNFEYYSEDPLLTAKQAAALVKGVQSGRIGTSVKHFALNNKETNRKDSDSRASERAIREIYIKAFEIIVKEAQPWTIMSSYNIINGHRASENKDLLTGILRDEWGFEGMVTTDWWTYAEHYKEVKAGNDVKMACGYPEKLLEAKEKGVLSREEMEICGKRILELILKVD